MASAIRARLSQQGCCERPATLALRKDSHAISKMKPKIRIVHIFAPEIIKTDVENFRELVQRLTGKPKRRNGGKKKAAPGMVNSTETMGMRQGHRDSWRGERAEGELQEEKRELWREVSSGGFLSGFSDVDGFFHGLGDFPLLPLSSSDMGVIGEARISRKEGN
ncbi:VQ motif-containing protein 25 [Phoenix dactylifera]|uniref:VQ motif-containing protein 25 n=1 Tax=Phoenix dactylifera TaxID=42345 RepID=A0A8B7BQ70_PHODC|nr:VQ motif-containing protein 25 [Phoenix dactylifera]